MISNELNLEQLNSLSPEELKKVIDIFNTLSVQDFIDDNARPCYLYLHLNKSNRKKYFGITTQKITRRWKNGSSYSNNSHFYNAIKLYGWENFYHIVLCDKLTIDAAKKLEVALIRCFDTTNPEFGYNKTIGGEGGCKYYTKAEATLAQKEVALRSARKRYANPETRKAVIAAASKYQRKIRQNPEILEQKRAMQRAVRRKVKEIRDRLRELYSNQPSLFTEEQAYKAFGFQEDNKTYVCQSAKELTALFGLITGGDANG
jgi:hypothetical protein